MRSALSVLVLALVASLCAAMTGGEAWGFSLFGREGDFELGQWAGDLSAGYTWEDQQTHSPQSNLDLLRNRYDEDLDLRNQGFYLIDPRLIEGMAGVNLDFFQEADKIAGRTEQWNGTLIGYNVSTGLLSEKAYTANLFSNRTASETTTDFAGIMDMVTSNFGAVAQLRDYSFLRYLLPYFSLRLNARQDETDQQLTQFGQTYTYDDTRDTMGMSANKGFQTADLDLEYELVKDTLSGTDNLSYDTQWLMANYSLDFGRDLNRHWSSRISYYDITGSFGQTMLYADERLSIDHFRNLSTTYDYLLARTQAAGQTETTHTGTFILYYQMFRSLGATLSLQGMYETLSIGYMDFYAGEIDPVYTRSIPWGGSLQLTFDGRYQIDDNNLSSGTIQVVDEQHVAPSVPNTGFSLNNPFALISTIVIFDVQSGSRIPTELGVDYKVLSVGSLAQIVILPTSLIIHPGDALEISYEYQVEPNARFAISSVNVNAGVSFSWIDVALSYGNVSQNLISGQASQFFLYNLTTETASIDVHKDMDWYGDRASAEFQNYDQTFVAYTMEDFNEYAYARLVWNLRLGVLGDVMFTDYTIPSRRTSTLDLEVNLDRYGSLGNYFSVYGRLRHIADSELPAESDLEAGLQGHWQYGKVHFEPVVSWLNRKWGPVTVNDPCVTVRLGRYL